MKTNKVSVDSLDSIDSTAKKVRLLHVYFFSFNKHISFEFESAHNRKGDEECTRMAKKEKSTTEIGVIVLCAHKK